MAGIDPFELLGKLKTARTDMLVDALRRLHQNGSGNLNSLEELLNGKTERPGDAQQPPAPSAATAEARGYEELRRHFVPYAEQLRQQALLTEKLLNGFMYESKRPAPAVLQQEIRIQASPGTQSGARFAVLNSLDHPAEVSFRTGRVHGLSEQQRDALRIQFEPERPRLGPNEEKWIHVRVDVADREGLPERIETGVDLLGEDRLLLKLWIQVELRTRKSGHGQT
jgi:hypothetical protein